MGEQVRATTVAMRDRRGAGSPRPLVALVACALLLAATACRDDPAAPANGGTPPPGASRPVAEALPTLSITTNSGAPITSKDVYAAATYRLAGTDNATLAEGALDIRGRGNSTWGMPKKPYRVRLASSTALLGMPANRHWVLLANYSDKTLVRNDVAFELSRRLGMEYTPRSQFVDVTVNGNYEGIYQLTEHVRIGSNRVNIPELQASDTSATAITGGYLIEVDERRGEDFCHASSRTPMVFCFSNPETLREAAWARHRAYITSYLDRVDSVIFSPGFADPQAGYAAYLDVASLVDYYLIQEWFKNVDGNLRLSTYLYKKRGGKLHVGPIWDFDIAMGNVNYLGADNPAGWHIRTAPWFTRLFQDPAFTARVRGRWNELRTNGTLDSLDAYIGARQANLGKVQQRNFQRWPILNTWVWPNRVVTGSWEGEYNAMAFWLLTRRRWMEGAFGN